MAPSPCRPRPRPTNRHRGEVLVEFAGSQYIARPTLAAVVALEEERGPFVTVAGRIASEPGYADCVAILAACIEAADPGACSREEVERGVVACGLERAASWAWALVGAYFVRGEHATESQGERDVEARSFPALEFVGQAVAVWHQSPADVWGWTVPEWWAAFDAHVMANGGPTKKKGQRSREEAHMLADIVRAAKREERAAALKLKQESETDGLEQVHD